MDSNELMTATIGSIHVFYTLAHARIEASELIQSWLSFQSGLRRPRLEEKAALRKARAEITGSQGPCLEVAEDGREK